MIANRALTQSLRAAGPTARRIPLAAVSRRGYAEAAKQNSKPPVALFGLDGTYASALYTAAVKTSTLDPTASALARLETSFKNDAKLSKVLSAPTLSASDKSQIISELLKVASVNTSEAGKAGTPGATLKNFLDTLAENNRLSTLEGVCTKFGQLMSAHRGEVELVVTSAERLDGKVLKQLETAVGKSRFVGQGKKLKVVPKVQPDIRGGLIVEIGDRTIDLSVAARMARMNKLLQDTL